MIVALILLGSTVIIYNFKNKKTPTTLFKKNYTLLHKILDFKHYGKNFLLLTILLLSGNVTLKLNQADNMQYNAILCLLSIAIIFIIETNKQKEKKIIKQLPLAIRNLQIYLANENNFQRAIEHLKNNEPKPIANLFEHLHNNFQLNIPTNISTIQLQKKYQAFEINCFLMILHYAQIDSKKSISLLKQIEHITEEGIKTKEETENITTDIKMMKNVNILASWGCIIAFHENLIALYHTPDGRRMAFLAVFLAVFSTLIAITLFKVK